MVGYAVYSDFPQPGQRQLFPFDRCYTCQTRKSKPGRFVRKFSILTIGALVLTLSCKSSGTSGATEQGLTNVKIQVAFPALTFNLPLAIADPGDGSNRLFVEEQDGRILVFANSTTATTFDTFLNITDRVARDGMEEGLLGLAFDPSYATNGYFYVNYTTPNPLRTRISRFNVSSSSANLADPNSELVLLEFNQPFSNHNGGCLQFGPDGDLYIGVGDGGSGGDPNNNAQNKAAILGKMLRIDVRNSSPSAHYAIPTDNPFAGNSSGYKQEIFAYGLRNPWRFSFDGSTGRLWCADVGQDAWEEVDIIENSKNYGWRLMEANHCYNPSANCDTTGLTRPIWEYSHATGQSITGGYVYRGATVPTLEGKYVYADFVSGKIWALTYVPGGTSTNQLVVDTDLGISSFGVDHTNELYFTSFDGRIYRFVQQ
jgi:glucose/arabinose dehydrogenase